MLILASTSDIVRIVTGSTGDIESHASWIDNASGTITVGRTNTASISTATTTTVVGSPGASTQRNTRHLNILNNHATTSNAIRVEHFDGTTAEVLWKGTLLAGESIVLDQGGRWTYYDATGNVKASTYPAASQAEMEAASSNVVAVTPSNLKWHPGVAKFWAQVTGGAANVLTTSYNVSSITDNTAGRLRITLSTAFSSANWACLVTTFTADANTADEGIPNIGAKAAGTVDVNNRIVTPVYADPNVGYDVVGFGDQ